MVRNRSTDGRVDELKKLVDKFAGIMLVVSAIVIWLVIIIAISFLMIDNHRLRGAIRVHDENDEQHEKIREQLREDINKVDQRLKKLEESHK